MAQQIGFKCNRGVVRKNNEDACFVIPSKDVYIVADGVGGNNSGEIASSTAVETLASFVKDGDLEDCETPEEIFEFFTEAIDVANENIYRQGQKKAEQDQAGRELQGERIPTSEETISSVSSCPEENKKDRYGLFSHLGGM